MNELKQRSDKELEALDQEKNKQKELLETLKGDYENSIKMLSSEYEQKIVDMMNSDNKELSSVTNYLQLLSNQQKTIIKLLSKPSDSDSIAKQLQPLFTEFLNGLMTESQKSQTALTEVKELLTKLTNGLDQ